MSYLVLARKYRPNAFSDLIGQEHITSLLTNAIGRDRVAHAYLFCGPRGVGKTSCARILAMALNNPDGPSATPDLESPVCKDIAAGNSFDVLEIDGASNRGIDEIRSLRENSKFAPTYGKYKIYIVDEVHMLTSEAFNALLKTLEEPPEHVKFIFATTEPNKVPATIISRCQRFDFKRVQLKTIGGLIEDISKKEKLEIDSQAVYAIAKAAKGSLRDALSILDQLSAISERDINAEDVFSMLGMVETQLLFDLTDALAARDCTKALDILENILEKGKDIKQLARDLTEHFRNLMVIKVGGKSLGKLVDYPIALKEALLKQTDYFTLEEILNAVNVIVQAQETARIVESLRLPLEVAFAKLTYDENKPDLKKKIETNLSPVKESSKSDGPQPAKNDLGEKKKPLEPSIKEAGSVKQSEPKKETPEPNAEQNDDPVVSVNITRIQKEWDAFTHAISRHKMSVATFLQDGKAEELLEDKLVISFPNSAAFSKEALETQANISFIQDMLFERYKQSITIKYVIADDYQPTEHPEQVKSVIDEFGGSVVNQWHNE